ncbi:MAG: LptF/LptG family permease [Bacteroides sp.]|nr:LptF/LptG family permease [Bacteroides sp.]MCM1379058.1 LptF/LptG family permease [Bacteroides sp.]MCM1445756.1 LptF/LptG family permease [Prevotella sp.]
MKTLDRFMLRQFLPLFVMTFFICTFIVLMQFLWLHLQDLVGKGVSIGVLAELFFYAALSMVPMALPLAVLLASLMTFGNIGESMELTALKAGGISLFRVMSPLIVLIVFVSIGAFFFQNDVLPLAQTKMWTLLKSVRQKTPELDIAEGEFNYQLPNINIYVESKNRESGMLYAVMIYDFRQGFDRSRVILADSATLRTSPDKTHMLLDLHRGELFENLREGQGGMSSARNSLYRSEQFSNKLITVAFDMNLNMMDESEISNTYAGKNVSQLRHSIDSLQHGVDSVGQKFGNELANLNLVSVSPASLPAEAKRADARPRQVVNIDSIFARVSPEQHRSIMISARNDIDRMRWDYQGHYHFLESQHELLRRHGIELNRRFTLSLACLIFFFIGAPLGAIIRKGGLGTPLVISVFLFIFYYIIDNMGYRLARDGKIPVIEGVWLSSAVLLPLGIFVTYKAVKDSSVFNADSYMRLLRAITGKNQRALTVKEVVIEDYDPAVAAEQLAAVGEALRNFTNVVAFNAILEPAVSYMANTRSQTLMNKLNDIPIIEPWFQSPLLRLRLRNRLRKIESLIPEIQTINIHEQH